MKVGKCDVDSGYGGGYRRRRDTEEELEAEFAQLMEEIDSDDGFSGTAYFYVYILLTLYQKANNTVPPPTRAK